MKKPNKSAKAWTAETRRVERKDRLSELKGQDGHHRSLTQKSPRRPLFVVVAVLLVIAVLTYAAFSLGLPQRTLAIMTVGGQKIRVAQFNYWYGNILGQYGLTKDSAELQQILSTDAGGTTGTSVYDYLIATTATQLQRIYTEAALAKDEGVTLGEYQRSVDSQIASLIKTAGSAGLADMMLKQTYGTGCSIGMVRSLYETLYLSTKYAAVKAGAADVSTEALAAYYTAHKNEIDKVDYRGFAFSFTVSATATAAENASAKTEAKKKADAFLAAVKTEEDFKTQALAATAEADRAAYTTADKSKLVGQTSAQLTTGVSTWMFDAARKAGDASVIENTTDYSVVYFISRVKPVTPQSSVRHILIGTDTSAAAAAKTNAKAKADSLLAQVTTEQSFIDLVAANSDDVASIAKGGLYTGLVAGASYTAEFLAWSIDPVRKAGDKAVVETEYGYHVMYYSGTSPEWENTVRTALQDQAYEDFVQTKLKEPRFAYTLDSFALRFVI